MNLFTDGMGIFEGISIFANLENIGSDNYVEPAGDFEQPLQSYLQKGEKIQSLLRQKEERRFREDQTLEIIKHKWSLTVNAVMKKFTSVWEAQYLEKIRNPRNQDQVLTCKTHENGYSAAMEACAELSNHVLPCVSVKPENRPRPIQLLNGCLGEAAEAYLCVTDCQGEEYFIPVGKTIRRKYEKGKYRLRRDKDGDYMSIRNFQSFFSVLYLKKYLLQYFRDLQDNLGDEEYLENRLVERIARKYIPQSAIIRDAQELRKLNHVPESIIGSPISAAVYGLLYFNHDSSAEELVQMNVDEAGLYRLLMMLSAEYQQKKESSKYERNLSGDYAKSFQTKKNIPDKYVRAMSRSGFNDYFGYVEYDEDCDLQLLSELQLEYRALATEVGIPSYQDASLRFRKLGNHKASGLYYPALACLCVDIRSPGSFAHEVGHMIDYHCGHISEKAAFTDVYDRYKNRLLQYVKDGEPEKVKVLQGKTKYNLAYYLQSTEVFARCFEIYLARIRKVDNSLLSPTKGFAYPEDEELEVLIESFYTTLIENLESRGNKIEERERKVS